MNEETQESEGANASKRRVFKHISVACVTFLVFFFVLAVLGIYDITAPYRYKKTLINELSHVNTLEAAHEASGYLGAVLEHEEGQWTVIAYKDAHNFGHPSVAIAKMSDGSMFESQEHHCGQFRYFSSRLTEYLSSGDGTLSEQFPDDDEHAQLLCKIQEERDPFLRKQLLSELGFIPLN